MDDPVKLEVGKKVKFQREKQRYTIQAANGLFAICTKPFNPKHTVLYTIIDFSKGIRGTENLIFGLGFETKKQCEEALMRLTIKETEVSRNNVPLDIERIYG